MLHCPDTLLEFYALNQLNDRETAFVETHYLACRECADKTEAMVHFVVTLRAVLREQYVCPIGAVAARPQHAGYQIAHRLACTRSLPHLQISMRLHAVQGVVGEDEEGSMARSPEDEVDRPLWNVDAVDLLAGLVVHKDLAVCDVDVPVRVDGDAFAATVGEGFEVG
jgi:hypothetical protein